MRLEPVRAPDALHGADANPGRPRHSRTGPVRRFVQQRLHGQRDDTLGDRGIELRDARRPRFVAQKSVHAFGGETLLPAPDAGLGLARLAHDRVRPGAPGAQQNDLRPPDMLLRCVAVFDQSDEPIKVGGRDGYGNARAHAANSHAASPTGIPLGIQCQTRSTRGLYGGRISAFLSSDAGRSIPSGARSELPLWLFLMIDWPLMASVGLVAARLLLSITFLVAAGGKLVHPVGGRQTLIDFGVPHLAAGLATALPLVELTIGSALIVGRFAWFGSVGALTLLLLFALAIGANLAVGRAPVCNCFGTILQRP